jgi:hypothetical protein
MGSDETYSDANSLPRTEGQRAALSPDVPLAAPIEVEWPSGSPPSTTPWPGPPPFPPPWPSLPQLRDRCDLRHGCYQISFRPLSQFPPGPDHVKLMPFYLGTMRVDRAGGLLTISGDLYRFSPYLILEALGTIPIAQLLIPIYKRDRYYSYLKVIQV